MRIVPSSSPASRAPVLRAGARRAQEAAIERSLARYIKLMCGHHTTIEADNAYAYWRPKRTKSMCEVCGRWVERVKPVRKKVEDNTEPLF